jgi:hypothetical protein
VRLHSLSIPRKTQQTRTRYQQRDYYSDYLPATPLWRIAIHSFAHARRLRHIRSPTPKHDAAVVSPESQQSLLRRPVHHGFIRDRGPMSLCLVCSLCGSFPCVSPVSLKGPTKGLCGLCVCVCVSGVSVSCPSVCVSCVRLSSSLPPSSSPFSPPPPLLPFLSPSFLKTASQSDSGHMRAQPRSVEKGTCTGGPE